MQIHRFTVGPFAENTYLLIQEGEALLVDPGFHEKQEFDQVKSTLEDENVSLLGVVLTHAHVDHVWGLDMVLNKFDVPVFLNDKDRYLWKNFESQAALFGFKKSGFTFDPEPLLNQSDWTISNFAFDVRYTPGHSPDHVSLYSKNDGLVVAGDVLFKEGIGRTDLYKGDFGLLKKSIREQLYTLPDETVIYPGHGPETTVGHEKRANPLVKA